jgi:hypothetical protein
MEFLLNDVKSGIFGKARPPRIPALQPFSCPIKTAVI